MCSFIDSLKISQVNETLRGYDINILSNIIIERILLFKYILFSIDLNLFINTKVDPYPSSAHELEQCSLDLE